MLFLKKLLYSVVIPPGIFIVVFLVASFWLKGLKRYVLLLAGVLLYLFSITPVKDLFLYPLEKGFRNSRCDRGVIVVLSGGVYGQKELSEDSFKRVLKGFEIQKRLKGPIILTGGRVNDKLPYEADLMKAILVGLGVEDDRIYTDKDSRDTVENVRFTLAILQQLKQQDIILVTSAYHTKRSMILFKKSGINNICAEPADFKFDGYYSIYDFLPVSGNLNIVSKAFKEYLGIMFYTLKG
ncbi:MAG: YdcF family protein [Calditerrivibrio sp.]|nr:YdcF family protein [Calditerrivibrio sp.]